MTIATPEGIDLEVDLAGVGTRFLAGLIDGLVQIGLLLVAGLVLAAISDVAQGLALAFFFIVLFLVVFGYDVAFEILNSGRTPGKAALGLRVVRLGGGRITFLASVVRNLLRLVDGFSLVSFPLCPVGVGSILATRRDQRLGDLAAGTVVTRDRPRAVGTPATLQPAAYAPDAPFLGWDVSAVTLDELATVRRFLERRGALAPDARARLGWELAERLRPKIAGLPTGWHPEAVLEGIVAAKAARG